MRAAAEQGNSRVRRWNPGTYGTQGRDSSAFPQVTGLASERVKIVKVFEFMSLSSAPGRIRTCAHGSGGRGTIRP